MIPRAIFRAKLNPAPHVLLLLLWNYAGATDGDADGVFVWPSLDTLQATLGYSRSAIYRSLATLCTGGWVERASRTVSTKDGSMRRRGFVLHREPTARPDVADDGSGFLDGESLPRGGLDALQDATPDAEHVADPAVPSVGRKSPIGGTEKSHAWDSLPYQEVPLKDQLPPRASVRALQVPSQPRHDDDGSATRIWDGYEARRVEALGGPPARTATRTDLRKLTELKNYVRERFSVSVRNDLDAWEMVESYGKRAIELALEAFTTKPQLAPRLVACRSDGREWAPDRLDAVMARVDVRPKPKIVPPAWSPPWKVDEGEHLTGERVAELATKQLEQWRASAE